MDKHTFFGSHVFVQYLSSRVVRQENVDVNVYVYSLISYRVWQTSQFTPLVLENSFTVSSHLGRIQCIFCR